MDTSTYFGGGGFRPSTTKSFLWPFPPLLRSFLQPTVYDLVSAFESVTFFLSVYECRTDLQTKFQCLPKPDLGDTCDFRTASPHILTCHIALAGPVALEVGISDLRWSRWGVLASHTGLVVRSVANDKSSGMEWMGFRAFPLRFSALRFFEGPSVSTRIHLCGCMHCMDMNACECIIREIPDVHQWHKKSQHSHHFCERKTTQKIFDC